jgi:hypothetical protein
LSYAKTAGYAGANDHDRSAIEIVLHAVANLNKLARSHQMVQEAG